MSVSNWFYYKDVLEFFVTFRWNHYLQ